MADNNQNQNQTQTPQQDELVNGVVGLFHTISGRKTRIVYTNIFTGQLKVKASGLFFNFPWRIRPVTVSLNDQKVDTPERKTHTRTIVNPDGSVSYGPEICYDVDYFLKIEDPVLFMSAVEADGSATIRKDIGDKLDQLIRDYIILESYDALISSGSVNFEQQINQAQAGHQSLAAQLRNDYGVKISSVMLRLKPPRELIDEANKTKVAEQASRTAAAEAQKARITAQGEADVTRITAEAQAEKDKTAGAALAINISSWIAAGMTNEQIAEKLRSEALVNGANPNTIVLANAINSAGAANQGLDPVTIMALFNAMMRQQNVNGQQPTVGQPTSVGQQSVSSSSQPSSVDWSSLSDDFYLTAEDSAKLAAERGVQIQPGGRYHIGLLNADEKTRYVVASQKGRTR